MTVDWYFGSVTGVAAELYVRVYGGAISGGCVTGPRSAYARTLESTVSLVPTDASEALWRARIEEPCFWTPRRPYLYTVRVEVADRSDAIQTESHTLGVPVLVARNGRLESEGKNWVVRAFRAEEREESLLAACHASATGLLVNSPADELCESASVDGVQLIADLAALSPEEIETELRRIADWPAAAVAILPDAVELDPRLRRETSHVVKAQVARGGTSSAVRDWAQLLVVEAGDIGASAAAAAASRGYGILARSRASSVTKADDAESQVALGRQSCDSLQAELARRFSGALPIVGYLAD